MSVWKVAERQESVGPQPPACPGQLQVKLAATVLALNLVRSGVVNTNMKIFPSEASAWKKAHTRNKKDD